MKGRFFTKEIKPDIVNGDISDVIASNAADAPFGQGDVLFDWTSFTIPKGGAALVSVCAYVMGEDGGEQGDQDLGLVFARQVNASAPASLGAGNAIMTTGFDMPAHFVGATKLEGTTEGIGTIDGPAFGQVYTSFYSNQGNSGGGGGNLIVLEGEQTKRGVSGGYDTMYVAGFVGGAMDFSTGVLKDGAESSNTETSLTTKTVDPRKCFQVGDTVYIHDVDTAIGTVKSMTATNITLNAAIAGGTDIADEDEFINANPIRLVLGFER